MKCRGTPGLAHESGGQQAVEQLQRGAVVELRRGRGEIGLERIARHRGALEQPPRARVERSQLAVDRLGDRSRQVRDRPRAHELLDVERVAAALAQDRVALGGGHVRADQRQRVDRVQRPEIEPQHRALPLRGAEALGQQRGDLGAAHRDRDQHAGAGRASQQRHQQLQRGRIGVVHVVQREHQRLRGREPAEQLEHGAMRAVALGGEHRRGGLEIGERREYAGELRRLQAAQAACVERSQVRVERVDERAVGQVALELGGPAREHEHPAAAGVVLQRAQQARLADPGLARDGDDRRDTGLQLVERPP